MIAKGRLNQTDIQSAEAAAERVVITHQRLSTFLRAGLTLAEIDKFVAQTLAELECRSCFLGYRVPRSPAFPSHACLSVNDCIVHGTAAYYLKPVEAGDLLKIDIGVTYRGWIGDAAWTYSIGEPRPEVRKLMDCGKEALRRGIAALGPGKPYLPWARVVQDYVERECGFHVVRGLGGHGIGRKLHDAPYIANTMPTYAGEWPDGMTLAQPGTLIALEPMIAVGTGEVRQKRGEWPIFTADGSWAAHHEHDIMITEDGVRVLTQDLDQLPDVITR